MKKKFSSAAVLMPLAAAIAFIGGIICCDLLKSDHGLSPEERKFRALLNIIENEYVDEVDVDSLIEAAIPALFTKLDPHSLYIPASELQGVNDELESSFCGVGIHFSLNNDTIAVLEAVPNGPSERAGIKAGDRIIEVDGKNVAGVGITNEEVLTTLRGERDSKVTLTVKRRGVNHPLDFEVTRGDVPVASVDAAYMITDQAAYIRINKFGRNTYKEFWDAMWDLKDLGAKEFILDLRSNTGGFMDQAVLMANEFLNENDAIVYTKGRRSTDSSFIGSDGTGMFRDNKLIVLIDEISASASEIFAGAIQDNDRGLILGRRSFGKGLVQRQIDLPDSSAIRLTVARYYTPSGRSIQKDYSDLEQYENEIYERYYNGEAFESDSIHYDESNAYLTAHGRTVYGGGGITPDIFVPVDTTGVSNYFRKVSAAGLFNSYAIDFVDNNREILNQAEDLSSFLALLPSDYALLRSFAAFAAKNGVPAQWSGINHSAQLIVNRLKAFIARDVVGLNASIEISNEMDNMVNQAVEMLKRKESEFPVTASSAPHK